MKTSWSFLVKDPPEGLKGTRVTLELVPPEPARVRGVEATIVLPTGDILRGDHQTGPQLNSRAIKRAVLNAIDPSEFREDSMPQAVALRDAAVTQALEETGHPKAAKRHAERGH